VNTQLQQKRTIAHEHSSPFAVGIDLGTTNSLLAIAGSIDSQHLLPVINPAGEVHSSVREYIPVRLLQLPQANLDDTTTAHVLFPSVVYQRDAKSPVYIGIGAREAKYRERRNHSVFYSVKLDLGMDRIYPYAVSPDLDSPVKVSAAILRAMKDAAQDVLGMSLEDIPTIVTIPASFMSPQRRDTVDAAKMAGFRLEAEALFDEPVAALLGYTNRRRIQQRWNSNETVLVFDFGGGTCDVTIIDFSQTPSSGNPTFSMLAISRFQRLGGDDIDKHLVHTRLKGEFYRASGRKEREWGFGERQNRIWSQLAKVAELLKVRYCQELDKVAQASSWNEASVQQVTVSLPPQSINTSEGEIWLPEITLDWQQFQALMEPFLEPNGRLNADQEYYRLTSIFSPIRDALDKAELQPKEITRILLAGGSSFNPLVEQAIRQFFSEATVDRPENMDHLVAEGAAVYAYMKYVAGHDVLQPIAGDTLGLLAEGGEFVPLIRAGSPIPYPPAGTLQTYNQFRVPREQMTYVDLVICAGSSQRPIHSIRLRFDRPVRLHTPVHLQVGLDANKVFTLRAYLPEYPGVTVQQQIDNPLGLLPMTSKERRRHELESLLQRAAANKILDQYTDEMLDLADVLQDLDRAEMALQWIDLAERKLGIPTEQTQKLRAYSHYRLGEYAEAYKIFRKASDKQQGQWYPAYMAGLCTDNLDEREFCMRRAVAAAPGFGVTQIGLANALGVKGDHRGRLEALRSAQHLLEAEREHAADPGYTFSLLASVYAALGETGKAEQARQKAAAYHSGATEIDTTNLVGIARSLAR